MSNEQREIVKRILDEVREKAGYVHPMIAGLVIGFVCNLSLAEGK